MKRAIAFPLLAVSLWAWACDGPSPTAVDETRIAPAGDYTVVAQGNECVLRCTVCPPSVPSCSIRCTLHGLCRYVAAKADHNGNLKVCGATPSGPYIDDVARQLDDVLVVSRCPSPAYPFLVVLGS